LEAGGCTEVVRKLSIVRDLAHDTDEQVHVGGVIDRDFRTPRQILELQRQTPVYVLECHEIENLFIHPDALGKLLHRLGRDSASVGQILRDASDQFAGLWIVQRVATRHPELPEPTSAVRRLAGKLAWGRISHDKQQVVTDLVGRFDSLETTQVTALPSALSPSISAYETARMTNDFWKNCMGKQVMRSIPKLLGLSDVDALESSVAHMWAEQEIPPPAEAESLISYVTSLTT
jgi:hypothetical protein